MDSLGSLSEVDKFKLADPGVQFLVYTGRWLSFWTQNRLYRPEPKEGGEARTQTAVPIIHLGRRYTERILP